MVKELVELAVRVTCKVRHRHYIINPKPDLSGASRPNIIASSNDAPYRSAAITYQLGFCTRLGLSVISSMGKG